jgi:hypothetical protein
MGDSNKVDLGLLPCVHNDFGQQPPAGVDAGGAERRTR